MYCSKDCQKANWKLHKSTCQARQAREPGKSEFWDHFRKWYYAHQRAIVIGWSWAVNLHDAPTAFSERFLFLELAVERSSTSSVTQFKALSARVYTKDDVGEKYRSDAAEEYSPQPGAIGPGVIIIAFDNGESVKIPVFIRSNQRQSPPVPSNWVQLLLDGLNGRISTSASEGIAAEWLQSYNQSVPLLFSSGRSLKRVPDTNVVLVDRNLENSH